MSEGKEQLTVRIPAHLAKWCRDMGLKPQRLLELAINRAMGEMDPEVRMKEVLELEQRLFAEKNQLQAKINRIRALEREAVAIRSAVQASLEKSIDHIDWKTINEVMALRASEGYSPLESRDPNELQRMLRSEWKQQVANLTGIREHVPQSRL